MQTRSNAVTPRMPPAPECRGPKSLMWQHKPHAMRCRSLFSVDIRRASTPSVPRSSIRVTPLAAIPPAIVNLERKGIPPVKSQSATQRLLLFWLEKCAHLRLESTARRGLRRRWWGGVAVNLQLRRGEPVGGCGGVGGVG